MAAPQPPAPFGGASAAGAVTQQLEEYRQSDRITPEKEETTDTAGDSEEDRHEKIATLARSISQQSRQYSTNGSIQEDINTFLEPAKDPELDPNSDQFKSRKWVRNMLHITSRDPERYPRRTAGVTFRNLNVFGYGTAADYQMDVGNMWLKAAGWFKSALGFGKKVRIDILRDLEGMVNTGEMLVVLGRPGRYVCCTVPPRSDKEPT